MTAMPTVNPSTTGQGMNAMYRPSRAIAAMTSTTPAIIETTNTACGPYRATIGTRTTVIAPVGPETCTFEPPNTAATRPAMMAVIKPAVAPRPAVIPKASASGTATTPTVRPASTSPFHDDRRPA